MSLSASQHLSSFGITVAQAQAYIFANLNNLSAILSLADQYGVTNDMLAEIVGGGYTGDQVEAYFVSHGLDSSILDAPTDPGTPQYSTVVPEDLMELSSLITLNNSTGELATGALRSEVVGRTNSTDYWALFSVGGYLGSSDGTFSTADLGFTQLGSLPATAETMESLFYGTMISTLKAIDMSEINELHQFTEANQTALANGDAAVMAAYIDLIVSVFSDPATDPVLSDAMVNDVVVEATVGLVGMVQYSPSIFHSVLML
jgi:hypothetical protein